MRTYPPWFNGDHRFNVYMFLLDCCERFHKLGLEDLNGVDFIIFQFFGPTRQWWRTLVVSRPIGSPSLLWDEFAREFLEEFECRHKRLVVRRQCALNGDSEIYNRGQDFCGYSQRGLDRGVRQVLQAQFSRLLLFWITYYVEISRIIRGTPHNIDGEIPYQLLQKMICLSIMFSRWTRGRRF